MERKPLSSPLSGFLIYAIRHRGDAYFCDFIKSQLSDIYKIGDAGIIINEMVADELLIANDFDVKRKSPVTR